MKKIEKCIMIKMLEIFKDEGCNTLDEVIDLLNKELKNDDDIVYSWNFGDTNVKDN